jgi:ribosomal protein L40E
VASGAPPRATMSSTSQAPVTAGEHHFCTQCGAKVPPGGKFCGECGHQV